MNESVFKEMDLYELQNTDGGVKPSSVCLFVAGVAACWVSPLIGVPFFVATFDYEAA